MGEGEEANIVKGLNVTGRIKGITVSVITAIGLSACGGVMNADLFQQSFWAGGPRIENTSAELGMAELAKGNYIEAEKRFQAALKKNPQDVHALLGLGMLFQNNGQITRARQMYEALLAIRPDQSQQFVVWRDLKTRPISEIASVNLSLIESGGVLTSMGREDEPRPVAEPSMMPMSQPITGAPSPTAMTARAMPSEPVPQTSFADAGLPRFAEADSNIVSRFKTLAALRDQGLITIDEYNTRRQANIGALLPLTSPPPAAGLDRPVPSTEQISGRLRAIGRGLEMRAITISQHASERSMILDAMMPAAPVSVANPGRPPQGLLQAADSVRWLEQLREAQLITSDEYARERGAIEEVMSPPPASSAAPAMPVEMSSSPAETGTPMQLSGPQPGIHLASYRSRKDAERGWSQLRRAHKAELSTLQSEISEINLGSKGIFYRLKAGPLSDKGVADGLCRQLKQRRQFCESTFMNAG
jgi:tetratricopeptide (TPR) repeat protein